MLFFTLFVFLYINLTKIIALQKRKYRKKKSEIESLMSIAGSLSSVVQATHGEVLGQQVCTLLFFYYFLYLFAFRNLIVLQMHLFR